MLKQYKNQIFDIIRESQLAVKNFNYKETEEHGYNYFVIDYSGTPFEFHIGLSPDSFDSFDHYRTLFAPNFPTSDSYPENGYLDFSVIQLYLKKWINDIQRYLEEIEEIDLWAHYNKGSKSLNPDKITFDDHIEFSTQEKVQVKMALNEFESLVIQKFELGEAQISILSDRIEHLSKATEKMTKFDWMGVTISTLISITIALSLDTENGKDLFELFKQVFKAIQLIGG